MKCNPAEDPLTCPNCGEITDDGEECAECQQNRMIGDEYGRG